MGSFSGISSTPASMSYSCLKIAQKEDLCEQLTRLDDIQRTMLLLQFCHVARRNHLPRTASPALLKEAATGHETQTRATFIGDECIKDQMWRRSVLQICLGGFKLTSISSIARPAFIAAWSHSILELPLRFPYLQHCISNLIHKPLLKFSWRGSAYFSS